MLFIVTTRHPAMPIFALVTWRALTITLLGRTRREVARKMNAMLTSFINGQTSLRSQSDALHLRREIIPNLCV